MLSSLNHMTERFRRSLSAQLLLLTVIVVLITEVVIMIPSVAHQQEDWIAMRTEAAYLVGIALEDFDADEVNEMMIDKILMSASIEGVTLNMPESKTLVLSPDLTDNAIGAMDTINLDESGLISMIIGSWQTIAGGGSELIRVSGGSRLTNSRISDVILSRDKLRKSLRSYSLNILGLSLLISITTALFVYGSLDNLIIKPVSRMRANMAEFQTDPENVDNLLNPSARIDEIGEAERGLATLEQRLQTLLNERRRLAALGAGISKISHDLRNILASAQLMSDRLVTSEDPRVRKLSPRLVDALDRAITLSRDTLAYGNMSSEILNLETIILRDLMDDIFDDNASIIVAMENKIPADLKVSIDRTQFHRGITNLVRNAAQALAPNDAFKASADDFPSDFVPEHKITAEAHQADGQLVIDIADNGPGLPEIAREHLLEPFKGSHKAGGSGLGIAICAEIMRAHGGELSLHKSDETGATFRITLKDLNESPSLS